jgi:riboflavin biosynthesis pyrimidine reductase
VRVSSELEPLVVLREHQSASPLPLTKEIRALYGGGLDLPQVCLVTNFVATIDSVVAIPGVEHSNRMISDGSEADRFVMGILRACASAVVVGSGTMHSAPRTLWTAEQAFPPLASEYAALRRALGRSERPVVAVVTASGSLDPAHPALEEGALVLTTEGGAATLGGTLPAAAEVVALPGGDRVDLRAAIDLLRARGHGTILSEGGPGLFGSMVADGLVNELFLTVSPLLAGRGADERRSLVEGAEVLPGRHARTQLLTARVHRDHLFLRYRLAPHD